jgi:hypothetical protein
MNKQWKEVEENILKVEKNGNWMDGSKNMYFYFHLCTVHVVTFTLLKTNSCTKKKKTLFYIHIKTLKTC